MSDVTQEMQDRYEIEQVLRRYCRGVDRGDAELIRSVYHADGTDDHGGFKGLGVEFADRVVEAMAGRVEATMHNLHQINIFPNGDAARVETYFTAYHRLIQEGTTVLETFGGRYVDRFEKRLGQWKIADRVVVYDWSEIKDVPREYPNENFNQGKRSKDDLSYQPA
ncbi:MAG: linA-like protein [Gammaproteobacteria bacterium]|nr:linA-like protein [Gammaproteobacteria bacterium]|tara:strand:- start:94 stop:591 length:498 start_codon:yes stop_codon:yes gene_type:complete